LGVKKAATIHDGSPYAEGLANVFADVFSRLGGAGSITAKEAIAPTDTDMRPVLTKIAAGKPDLIYYPIFIAAGGFVTRQAKEVSGLANVKLMGADGIFSPDFWKAAGDAAKGMYHTSPDLSPAALGPGYKIVLDKHQKRYNEKPLAPFHPHAYDAAMIIFAAIEKVGKKDSAGNLYIGRKALRDALFATKGYKGLTGTLNCNEFGDCADPKIAAYQTISADLAKWNPGTDPKKVYP
jgi:branched-chain amino acid transport system substrate-binding protein